MRRDLLGGEVQPIHHFASRQPHASNGQLGVQDLWRSVIKAHAVDHGIEPAEQRLLAGKPAEGVVRLRASHQAGLLVLELSDDGHGVDLERLRRGIVERQLSPADTAAQLSEEELLSFLFLPGFSLRDTVTEVSGRGVGLDAVQHMVRQLRGSVDLHQVAGLRRLPGAGIVPGAGNASNNAVTADST